MKNYNSTIDMKGIESEFLEWFGMSSQSSCKYDDQILDSMKEKIC
jgi:hypothetical protein